MAHSKLYFWKDKDSCTKFYMERHNKLQQEVEHTVKLAMEYGSLLSFNNEADLRAFEALGLVRQ